jgi:hypothetical protein
MLDVHAPEHRIHGFRDFLVHLLTITVGLLIALGLEASVGAMHHRHERNEADEKIRLEMRSNRDTLVATQQSIQNEIKNMEGVLHYLEARGAGEPGDTHGLDLSFRQGTLKDAAWRTAGATGVLNYINYDTVQLFSEAYTEQDQFQAMADLTMNGYSELRAYRTEAAATTGLSPDAARTATPDVRHILAHLNSMLDRSRVTLSAYDEALK